MGHPSCAPGAVRVAASLAARHGMPVAAPAAATGGVSRHAHWPLDEPVPPCPLPANHQSYPGPKWLVCYKSRTWGHHPPLPALGVTWVPAPPPCRPMSSATCSPLEPQGPGRPGLLTLAPQCSPSSGHTHPPHRSKEKTHKDKYHWVLVLFCFFFLVLNRTFFPPRILGTEARVEGCQQGPSQSRGGPDSKHTEAAAAGRRHGCSPRPRSTDHVPAAGEATRKPDYPRRSCWVALCGHAQRRHKFLQKLRHRDAAGEGPCRAHTQSWGHTTGGRVRSGSELEPHGLDFGGTRVSLAPQGCWAGNPRQARDWREWTGVQIILTLNKTFLYIKN